MSARCVFLQLCHFRPCLISVQLAAIKLRQKAVADTASSFENLTQLGY